MTIGSLLEGGFRLIKERPGAMLIWTLIQLAATVAAGFATMAILQGNIDALMGGATVESVQASSTVKSLLVTLGGLVISTFIYAAVQRAILRRDEGGPGWLMFGMDEVRLFLLTMLYMVIFVVALVILGVVIGLFIGAAGPRALTLVLLVIFCIAGAWFATKVSLTFPLTLKEGAFAIGDGWRLTSGHFWTLLGTYLIIFLILLGLGIVNLAVTQPAYLSAVFQHGFTSFEAQQASVLQYQKLMMGEVDAPIIIGWLLTAIQGAVGYALFGGAVATAVQQLTTDEEGLSETFS